MGVKGSRGFFVEIMDSAKELFEVVFADIALQIFR
jgi:hypothetical protein